MTDWLDYPASVETIEKLWTDIDYLYFHEAKDESYYRITQEYAKRNNIILTTFLAPIVETLKLNSDFQVLQNRRPALLSDIAALKDVITNRIRDPKRLSDLITR